jgi:branched-chain amino acid transport system substrate-binding protein
MNQNSTDKPAMHVGRKGGVVMPLSRRKLLKSGAAAGALSLSGTVFAPAIAQNKPLRIGILAPRSGIAAAPGLNGIRATQWAVERYNAQGGIAGRKVELVIEDESSPKDTIERFSKLVQQENVDCVQGIISTGVGLALGPVVEEARALTIYWDGTTQDGVDEKIPSPRYLFRSTDNECEAVMSSLLAIKHWKGKFTTVAGINPDYSYGRNNMAAFIAILNRFGIDHKVVTEQWPKVGTMDLTSHVAALKAAKPDLIFSSLLFADLPVFMKQAHAAGLTEGTKLVFPAAGWQHTLMKKEFTPEGMLFGHNTLYFANPNASALAKEFVAWYEKTYSDYPEWEADRAYFAIDSYKAAVEKAMKAKGGNWPSQDDIIDSLAGLSIESLGGKSGWRKDHIADQTFVQGLTTHNNKYDFVTLGTFESRYSTELQKPPGANFWEWIKTAAFNV